MHAGAGAWGSRAAGEGKDAWEDSRSAAQRTSTPLRPMLSKAWGHLNPPRTRLTITAVMLPLPHTSQAAALRATLAVFIPQGSEGSMEAAQDYVGG